MTLAIDFNNEVEALMPITIGEGEYMTVSELAEATNQHRNNIHFWINRGMIEARRKGLAAKSPYIIPMDEAKRVIAKLTQADEQPEDSTPQ